MEITKITQQKNKNNLNLFVDGEFYSGITKEVAISNNFFVGKKVEKQDLDRIILQSQSKEAFAKATDFLATRLYSQKELKTKLFAKGFDKQAIDLAIDKLKEYGYINDHEFAKIFVEQNKNKSLQTIKNKLFEKGVDKKIAEDVLKNISEQDQFESCLVAANKFVKNKDKEGVKEKLFAHLYRKGFSVDIIKKTIKKVCGFDPDFD